MAIEMRKGSRGLGRGLAALIPPTSPGVSGARYIPVADIEANPAQPRRHFDEGELADLASSIASHGVLQPVLVVEEGARYRLVAGERRLRAARMAGLDSIPALVRDANEQDRLVLALVENLQREDLNALEEANGYRELVDAFGMTQEQVAQHVGRSRPTISNALRILETAPAVQQAVADGIISGGHARALAGVSAAATQTTLLATVVARSLSVRQTEALVAATREPTSHAREVSKASRDPDVQAMEARVREALGTKVAISTARRGGRITITWYDDEDLARLVERLTSPADR